MGRRKRQQRKRLKKLRRSIATGFGDFVIQAFAEFAGHLMSRGTKQLAKAQKRARREEEALGEPH